MRLDVLEDDLIQIGHCPRDPIQDAGLGLEQFVESWFVLWMAPRPPIIGINLADRRGPPALPVEERINSWQAFATQFEEENFTRSTLPTFQGCVSWKPERNTRFHVQDFVTEHHLSMAGQCKVDVVEVIGFLLPATAPFGAKLGVENAN